LGGGGTDLPAYYQRFGGRLLTASINHHLQVHIQPHSQSSEIVFEHAHVERAGAKDLDGLSHDLAREALKWQGGGKALDIRTTAGLPPGTGMGSSGAFSVALLKALHVLQGRKVDAQALAEEACELEMARAKRPSGKQDPYASALGGMLALEIEKNGQVRVERLNLTAETTRQLENRLEMFFTGIRRDAGGILTQQTKKVEKDDATTTQAMHTIKMLGQEGMDALLAGNLDAFGARLHAHWRVKKSISKEMSSPTIDGWYELAMKNGALGGKLMGAGGGGFLLFCAGEGKRDSLRDALAQAGLVPLPFRFNSEGVEVLHGP
jgi:D-glycero-alpha-D-manno-heptose-7-phosphate kinase